MKKCISVFFLIFAFVSNLFADVIELKLAELQKKLHKDGYSVKHFADSRFKIYKKVMWMLL